jgi:predicted  nucleic acid-binding Zn-ribbon protein
MGNSGGSNAIGKSTFLLILDFAFGGDSYTKSAKDVFKEIGHHQINMEFEFGGHSYFFYRLTNVPSKIMQSDDGYSTVIREMSVNDFREFLFDGYKINLPYLQFNDMIERFVRIYGHNSHSEHRPLSKTIREYSMVSIDNLLKMLGKYEAIHALKEAEAEHKHTPSKTPDRSVSDLSSKIGENKEKIEGLEKRQAELSKKNEDANLRAWGIDQEKSKRLVEAVNEIRQLDEHRRQLASQLRAVQNNLPRNDNTASKDFTALLRFFPEADVEALKDVENFHAKINDFLRADIEDEVSRLEHLIKETDAEIELCKKQLAKSEVVETLSSRVLDEYALVTREMRELISENKDLTRQLEAIEARQKLDALFAELHANQKRAITEAQKAVNAAIAKVNKTVTSGSRPAPTLTINLEEKLYEFGTLDDKSEGTTFKNLVVYDLSILKITPLPVLIHDSSIVKRIEDADFEQILNLYEASGKQRKQVFIAFDKADSYAQETVERLEAATVLHLSVGEELFGKSWSRRTEAATLGQNQEENKNS